MVLAQDVFLAQDDAHAYLRRGAKLTDDNIRRLATLGVRRVAVRETTVRPAARQNEPPALLQNARSKVITPQPVLDSELRSAALQTVEAAFSDIAISDTGIAPSFEVVDQMNVIVSRLVSSVMRSRTAQTSISDLKSFDEFTYHHSLSVAVLAIAIGQQLGLPTLHLNKLGMSAILHDIGKTAVPIQLVQKPAPLTGPEFDLMKSHSRSGSAFLVSFVRDEQMWQAVLSHHERLDGTGYPRGLAGRDIPLWGRIIAVADVYDALTSQRPHRPPVEPHQALEYIMGGIGTAFDYDVVKALVARASLYPVGSCVELSDGSLALVVDNAIPARPVVELLGRGTFVDLSDDRKYLNVVIQRLVPTAELARFR